MRRTKEDAERTRDEILNAAVELFSSKGVANTSLEDIAQAANVTRGAIYWHFKNKIELFEALHERLHRPLMEILMQDMQKDHPEPLLQLQELCIQMLTGLEDDPDRRKVLSLFMTKCDYSGPLAPVKENYCAKKAESLKLFSSYFEKAMQKGKLPAGADPALLTQAVNCYMKGILLEYLDNPERFDMKKKAPLMIKLFFGSLTNLDQI